MQVYKTLLLNQNGHYHTHSARLNKQSDIYLRDVLCQIYFVM